MNESDQWHTWSASVVRALVDTLHTTETVLAEVFYHLRHRRAVLDGLLRSIETKVIQVHPIFPDQAPRLRELMGHYDRMDLADASLVVLSEHHPRAKLITLDRRDFTVYRRNDGNPVPCIMPAA